MAHQNVITIGTGNIGAEFIAQVAEKDAPYLRRHPNPTNIVGMVNSEGWLYTPGGVAIQNSPLSI